MINEYAKAFFELSSELKNLENAIESFNVFYAEYKDEFKKLLLSPNISKQDKKEVIGKCFKSCDENFINFLNVIVDNSRVDMLDDIYKDFKKLLDEKNNIVNIDVYSFEKISKETEDSIISKLNTVFKDKTVILNNIIDNTLIGGYKIFHDGKQIDASIKNQFKLMKENL